LQTSKSRPATSDIDSIVLEELTRVSLNFLFTIVELDDLHSQNLLISNHDIADSPSGILSAERNSALFEKREKLFRPGFFNRQLLLQLSDPVALLSDLLGENFDFFFASFPVFLGGLSVDLSPI
jgi:hypothetical protein